MRGYWERFIEKDLRAHSCYFFFIELQFTASQMIKWCINNLRKPLIPYVELRFHIYIVHIQPLLYYYYYIVSKNEINIVTFTFCMKNCN